MRMNLSKRAQEEAPITLPMTPMIDIIFQLIIFFLCTLKFRQPEAQQVINLPPEGKPRAGVSAPVPDVPLALRRNPNGVPGAEDYVPQIRLAGNSIVSWKGLQDSLKILHTTNPDIRIVLDIGSDVIHDNVVRTIDQCSAAEIKNVSFGKPAGP